jgi:hypothetical protein
MSVDGLVLDLEAMGDDFRVAKLKEFESIKLDD